MLDDIPSYFAGTLKTACTHLLVHDDGQLSGEISVVGFHLVVILLLVFFNESLIDPQAVAARLNEMPACRGDRGSGDAFKGA